MRYVAAPLPAITVGDTAPPCSLNCLAATFVIASSCIVQPVNANALDQRAAIGTCARVPR